MKALRIAAMGVALLAQVGSLAAFSQSARADDVTTTIAIGGPAIKMDLGDGQRGIANLTAKKGSMGVVARIEELRKFGSSYDNLCVYVTDVGGKTISSECRDLRDADLPFAFRVSLPYNGKYAVWAVPDKGFEGTVSLQLRTDKTASITPDGSAVTLDLLPGERGLATFTAKPGCIGVVAQLGDVRQSDSAYDNLCVYLTDPTGKTVGSECRDFRDAGTPFSFVTDVPSAGKYTLWAIPDQTFSGTVSLTLRTDRKGRLTPTGPALQMDLLPGQRGLATFTGKQGSIGVVAQVDEARQYDSGYDNLCVYLTDPSGKTVRSECRDLKDAGTPFAFHANLPSTGTYTVWAIPDQTFSGTVSLQLRPNRSMRISPKGPAVNMDLLTGQDGYATFAGAKGTIHVTAQLTEMRQYDALYEDLCIYVTYLNGTTINSTCRNMDDAGTEFTLDANLPRSGRYRLWVVPEQTFSGVVSLRIS